jgi:hypothetical protein
MPGADCAARNGRPIHEHLGAVHRDGVARDPDDPFDKLPVWSLGSAKDDHAPAFRNVLELVHVDSHPAVERGEHGIAGRELARSGAPHRDEHRKDSNQSVIREH